jgi:hypothetical protein
VTRWISPFLALPHRYEHTHGNSHRNAIHPV